MVSVHFYKAKSFLGKVVQFFLNGTYVHCAIQIDGKHIIETDAFKRVSLDHLYQVPDEVVWIEIDEKQVLTRFNTVMNTPYDYSGSLEFIGLGKQRQTHMTCVELCMYLLGKEPFNLSPDGFHKLIT